MKPRRAGVLAAEHPVVDRYERVDASLVAYLPQLHARRRGHFKIEGGDLGDSRPDQRNAGNRVLGWPRLAG